MKIISGILAAAAALTASTWAPIGAQAQETPAAQAVKRFFFVQVNDRCHLLTAPAETALKAGYVQARNAAIRAGAEMSALAPLLDDARTAAAGADCQAPQIAAAMATAQAALRTFVVQMRLDLPSGRTAWTGVRTDEAMSQWRLVQYQNTAQADFAFGLHGSLTQNSLSVMAHFTDQARPYAARLLVRNPDAFATGVINPAAYDTTRQLPMGFGNWSSLTFPAYDEADVTSMVKPQVKVNFAGFALGGKYVGTQTPVAAQRFDFPKAAIMAIARLDPREDVVIAFDCDDGPRYVRFEVGDFITGMAYVSLPSPYTHGN